MPSIGPYQLDVVHAGYLRLDGGAMYGIVPKPLWSRVSEPDERNRILLAMRCLLIRGEGRTVLVDAGVGTKYDDKFADIYGIDQSEHDLLSSLAALGVRPEEVTDVILTHLHFDHAGGATRREGDEAVPTFPEATVHVQRGHWEWALAAGPKESGSFLDENMQPLEKAGVLELREGGGELFPGVELVIARGHTHDQQLVKIDGPEGTLLYAADLLPTSHHLRPAWTMGYDVRPLETIDEKARLLERAVEEEWALFFEHDPEVQVANVRNGKRGVETYAERPLEELHQHSSIR